MEPEHDLDARDLASLKRVLGPRILDAMADPTTIELALNEDGRLWHERLGERMRCIAQLEAAAAMNIIRRIAGAVGAEITRAAAARVRAAARWLARRGTSAAGRNRAHVRDPQTRERNLLARAVRQGPGDDAGAGRRAAACDRRSPKRPGRRRYELREDHVGQRAHPRHGRPRPARADPHHRGHARVAVRRRKRRALQDEQGGAGRHPPAPANQLADATGPHPSR